MGTREEQLSPEEFGIAARRWLSERLGGQPDTGDLDAIQVARSFQADLYDAGFAGITFPAEWGGQGLSAAYQQAFDEEAAHYELPNFVFLVGLAMCGPTLVDLGTATQKRRYLRSLLRGEEIWSQLFSEPSAGSDVAGLRTRAVRDGDDWIVQGQKVWTSRAQYARFGALLARTDPSVPKHQGLTMFILDMHAPGVTVRPLTVMSGRSPFNEVFLDEVRVPGDAVLGAVGDGWTSALTMLDHERRSVGSPSYGGDTRLSFNSLKLFAESMGAAGEASVRRSLTELFATERAVSLLTARLREEKREGQDLGARSSVAKLTGALLLRQATAAFTEMAGPSDLAWSADDERHVAIDSAIKAAPSVGIAGGTNEIQRNIIGERILGLPREPSVERGKSFAETQGSGEE
ncbi:acyl-CoA dehydrogenase family protein [Microbacterium sp. A94]